ncbi:hypothetical protein CRG98_005690 [Punica granatum]|uniref:Uncharacterized protein n=1 Tax=Punica granatum TaxID=22663 RepID=A0A2I0L1D0_PUNGR|nr:hypothetical protein CRG98_005690 [Punica granatum]
MNQYRVETWGRMAAGSSSNLLDDSNLDRPMSLKTSLVASGKNRERDRGHPSTIPTTPLRSHAPTEDVDDHGGGVGVTNWQPHPRIYPDLELEISVDLEARATNRRPSTPPSRFPASSVGVDNLGGRVGVAN